MARFGSEAAMNNLEKTNVLLTGVLSAGPTCLTTSEHAKQSGRRKPRNVRYYAASRGITIS